MSGKPVGNADPLLLAYLLAVAAHMGTAAEMAAVLDMLTVAPARILGRRDHGVAAGCRADLVVLDACSIAEAVGAVPARRWVIKGGRVTVDGAGGEARSALDTPGRAG